jgi:PleD family two-component response regulator
VSVGIASVPPGSDAVSQAAIVNCADRALYEAKAKGRNAIVQATL